MADIPESTKMLPCPNPWCENIRGVEAARHITTAKWHICCGDCLIDGPWADTCDLAIAAWNTRAAPPAMDREAAYRQALEDVCNPLGYLQRMADAEGAKLSGMAYAIASDIGTIQRIAKEALSTLSADAIRQGEGSLRDEIRSEIINTPETADFMAGVPLEAAHQRERWGADHDAGKKPLDWFWLIGYLAQKAADAALRGDSEKAQHHTISTGAALANWHAALTGADNRMRPGIATPASLASVTPATTAPKES